MRRAHEAKNGYVNPDRNKDPTEKTEKAHSEQFHRKRRPHEIGPDQEATGGLKKVRRAVNYNVPRIMLTIQNLHARVEEKAILRGIDLTVNAGEVHAIMGPHGSGKSTLASILAGKDEYEVTEGSVTFMGEDLLEMDPEVRAAEGLFLAFQYPVEIPGVTNTYFLRAALNNIRKHRGEPELSMMEFSKHIRSKVAQMELKPDLLSRSVNEGFSGGEKKRNEIFQMAVLEPKLCVLDETDSGLDIDALKIVANGVNTLRSPERGVLVITHYQRLLEYIVPDFVHVLMGGRIVKSGGRELALDLEKQGYGYIEEELAAKA